MRFLSNFGLVFLLVFASFVDSQPVACTLGGSSGECQLCPNGIGVVSGDTFGAEIATSCVAGTITLGTNSPNCPITVGSPTSPSPVAIYHGSFDVYSPVINLGTATPSPGSITIGGSGRSIVIAPAIASPASVRIAADASTGPVTIGNDAGPTTAPNQLVLGSYVNFVSVGRNSVDLYLQRYRTLISPTPTPTPYSQNIVIGWFDSPTTTPAPALSSVGQNLYLGVRSTYIGIGYAVPTTVPGPTPLPAAGAGPVDIGWTSPAPSPSTQTINIGQYSPIINIGFSQGSPAITRIGNAVGPTPAGEVNVGDYSYTVRLGRNAAALIIGQNIRPTTAPGAYIEIGMSSSPGTQGADLYIGNRNTIYFGRNSPAISIGTDSGTGGVPAPGAGTMYIGWNTPVPTPTAKGTTGYNFNEMLFRGRYHDFYSAFCNDANICTSSPSAGAPATINVQTNVPTGGGVTAGYDTTNGRYYPIYGGVYLGCFNFLSQVSPTSNLAMELRYTHPPTPTTVLVANAFTQDAGTQASSCGMYYVPPPHVGTGYFYLNKAFGNINNVVWDNKFSIARIG